MKKIPRASPARTALVAMFAAITACGCFIAVPIGPGGIPIVMQNMFAILAALSLGGAGGALSALIFIAAGAIGLPVFSMARGGVAHLLGPTGGFILGYAAGALAAGLVAGRPDESERPCARRAARLALAALLGFAAIYALGVVHFMRVAKKPLAQALAACVVPFLPGDAIKLCASVPIALKIRPIVARCCPVSKSEDG